MLDNRHNVMMQSTDSLLSFPPRLKKFQTTGNKAYPGGQNTWKKKAANKPLELNMPSETMHDLSTASGSNWNLLQDTLGLRGREPRALVTQSKMSSNSSELYHSLFPGTSLPNHSQWDYCRKYGHAPMEVPAPDIKDMAAWFGEYGKPCKSSAPGFRSEFAATFKSVPHSNGQPSLAVRMIRGRVLR